MSKDLANVNVPKMSESGRWIVLIVGFLGWFCAGVHMQITQLVARPAAVHLLDKAGELDRVELTRLNQLSAAAKKKAKTATGETAALSPSEKSTYDQYNSLVSGWFLWVQSAFLFGAATGGLVFGWFGDRFGRSKGMAASILTYSLMSAANYFSTSPGVLATFIFLTGMGMGGMWPNGVALVSEAWSGMSRAMVAGVIGTSANVGIFLLATLAAEVKAISPDDWRWIFGVGALPVVLGLVASFLVPESPKWLAGQLALKQVREKGSANEPANDGRLAQDAVAATTETGGASTGVRPKSASMSEVFSPPFLSVTLVGIALATIPIIGGWGAANMMVPWADEAAQASNPPNEFLKARVGQYRAFSGSVGSLLGGWIASMVGRRLTYFLVSAISMVIAQYTFWFLVPLDSQFLPAVAALGFVSGIYFGWLPLCLPELFPTRVRSTGAGVSFNFGRIATAGLLSVTATITAWFDGDYAILGRCTSLAFFLGVIIICFAPDTGRKELAE